MPVKKNKIEEAPAKKTAVKKKTITKPIAQDKSAPVAKRQKKK